MLKIDRHKDFSLWWRKNILSGFVEMDFKKMSGKEGGETAGERGWWDVLLSGKLCSLG